MQLPSRHCCKRPSTACTSFRLTEAPISSHRCSEAPQYNALPSRQSTRSAHGTPLKHFWMNKPRKLRRNDRHAFALRLIPTTRYCSRNSSVILTTRASLRRLEKSLGRRANTTPIKSLARNIFPREDSAKKSPCTGSRAKSPISSIYTGQESLQWTRLTLSDGELRRRRQT